MSVQNATGARPCKTGLPTYMQSDLAVLNDLSCNVLQLHTSVVHQSWVVLLRTAYSASHLSVSTWNQCLSPESPTFLDL